MRAVLPCHAEARSILSIICKAVSYFMHTVLYCHAQETAKQPIFSIAKIKRS